MIKTIKSRKATNPAKLKKHTAKSHPSSPRLCRTGKPEVKSHKPEITPPVKRDHAVAVQQQKAAASHEFANLISKAYKEMQESARFISDNAIFSANHARDIGRMFLEWRGAEQMRQDEFSAFLRTHADELPLGLNLAAANHCISAFHRYPDEITELHDAVAVMTQMTFFATGLMAEPQRRLTQTASGDVPFQQFMLPIAKLREWIEKYSGDPDQIFRTVKDWQTFLSETEPIEKLREQAKEKIKNIWHGNAAERSQG